MELLTGVRVFETPWTAGYQAPLSMGFSRQEDWSGLPLPSPGDLPEPGIKPRSTAFQAGALPSEPRRLSDTYITSTKNNFFLSGQRWKKTF